MDCCSDWLRDRDDGSLIFKWRLPGEIAYGMLLCLGILLFAVTMDGISYGRRHRELFALQQSITVSLENLPEPGEILEEDYQRLLGILAEEKMRIWNTAVSEKR